MNSESMSDLTFTQTQNAMSKQVHYQKYQGQPQVIWEVAARHNQKPKVFIDRRKEGKKSNPQVFMGC